VEEESPANNASEAGQVEGAGHIPDHKSGEIDAAATVEIKDGHVNEKFLNVLLEAMEKSNLEGFDYMEFKQFLKSLDKVQMDETTKYRSAFATGQTMGATRDNLLSSAGRYLDILRQEEQRFQDAVKNQRSRIQEEKQSGITMLEKSIREKEARMAQLTTEIGQAKKEIQQGKEELALAQAKVQQTQNDFNRTYKLLVHQLQEDIEKIKTYLA